MPPAASTLYTYRFVSDALPPGAGSVLEVGCGAGALAALLQADGLAVRAIDSDAYAVEQARRAGVAAEVAQWPAELGASYDAVLFTRSLHHIHDLAGAVAEARRVLKPGGRVIIEDFRAEGGTARADAWFTALARDLHASGSLGQPVELDTAHDHELHSSDAIAGALCAFATVERADAAYYFRYLEPHLREPAAAAALLEQELATIASGAIEALGQRFVAFDG
ncbi:methyltransferase domain-containing protein [Sphingomonas sp.]|uniref:class I SAM-dependent methyltransferase n=1 Tax=Sphingomonas sp. TaxID=28214 RepID=UPI00286E86C6|nr:methyltransferase domain-containing protein [Sphingomonas sp.]